MWIEQNWKILLLLLFIYLASLPATDTKLMQYRLPLRSGKLCPKWVPSTDTASPLGKHRIFSQTTSSSRNDGQPWDFDSSLKSVCYNNKQWYNSKHNITPYNGYLNTNVYINLLELFKSAAARSYEEWLASDRVIVSSFTIFINLKVQTIQK